ncbi:hypothetical protein ALC62_14840 [Cyphomyrmex costatus]|uniref:Uncharacterized protein n=1 Tax=Cyphomyrmex costatus TaxID=456900 RepID=A0A195C2H9_9HYME|nr:hypothetical protein ALC62_14840 [Cyphomyrmex costatus]
MHSFILCVNQEYRLSLLTLSSVNTGTAVKSLQSLYTIARIIIVKIIINLTAVLNKFNLPYTTDHFKVLKERIKISLAKLQPRLHVLLRSAQIPMMLKTLDHLALRAVI